MTQNKESISVLLKEDRTFPPDKKFQEKALVKDAAIYEQAANNPEKYWENWAKELTWDKPWKQTLDWKPPHAKWFIDGKINACVNCVDRHVLPKYGHTLRKDKKAIIWEGEPGDKRTLTYGELYSEVNKFANALKSLGLNKGDRVAIYLPMTPEAAIACLACAKLGLVHSVVFGGFSAESLQDRINDAKARLLITADFGYRRGKPVELKAAADEALKSTPSIENVIVYQREPASSSAVMKDGRDLWWHDLVKDASEECEPAETDAEDMLFILYTSGTTGKPKGIVHTTGGYLTGTYATTKWVFDLKEDDVYWCTADVGWITGHSYVIYGPLANGATILMYEGSPDYPEKNRFWKIIEDYKVTIFYTAPTAIRTFMKWGTEWLKSADLSSLRLLGTVGEPINPEAWMWYRENVGRKNCPIVDTWWQTETGAIMITPLPGITTTKPGSATKPFPGISAEILNEQGEVVESGGGYVSITKPWPSMLRTIYGDDQRFQETYWSKWKDIYFPGDGAKRDDEGYFWFLGRVDDVMNVSGHRLGTMEVESALVDHPSVAESAVVSRPHEIKGEGVVAFVTLKEEAKSLAPEELIKTLKAHVVKKIGAIARPEEIIFTADLPKTRSGKIMRRLLRDIATGKALGDTTTLADTSIVEGLKKQYEKEEG